MPPGRRVCDVFPVIARKGQSAIFNGRNPLQTILKLLIGGFVDPYTPDLVIDVPALASQLAAHFNSYSGALTRFK